MQVPQFIQRRVDRHSVPLWFSLLILLVGMALTERAWHWVQSEEVKEARLEFEHAGNEAVERLHQRLRVQAQVLYAANGLYAAAGVNRQRWREFVGRLDLGRQFPGMQAIAYSPLISAVDLPRALTARRAEGGTPIRVSPDGSRSSYQPIWYVAPETEETSRDLGYDLGADPVRNELLARARDRDATVMSGKVSLAQGGKLEQPGFLLLHPLYSGAADPKPDERARRLAGFVMAAFRVRDFVLATFPFQPDRKFDLKIFDAAMAPGKASLLFDSNSAAAPAARLFHAEYVFAFAGGTWQMVFDSTPAYDAGIDRTRSKLVLNSGLVITLLLTLLGGSLAGSRFRALRRIESVTADLRASQERFELAIAATEDGVWDRDLVTRSIYFSSRFEAMLGYAPGELRGKIESIGSLLHPEDVPRWETALEAHLQHRRPYDIEYRVRHRSGEWRWFRSRGQAVWNPAGQAVRMVGSLSDITQSKLAAARLERQREYLVRLIDVIPDPVAVKDCESRYVLVNRAFADAVGRAAADIAGRLTIELLPEPTAAEVVALDRQILLTGEGQVQEISAYDARYGAARNVVVKKSLTTGPDDERLLVSIHSDVTDLRRALARFEAVIDETPLVAVVGLDRQGRVAYWNSACESLYEVSRRDALGKSLGELMFGTEAASNFQWLVEQVWQEGRASGAAEYLIPMKSGKRVWIYSALYPVLENGVVTEVFGMGVDVTERRRFEDELKQHRDHLEERVAQQTAHLLRAKDEAERANQAKSTFLANMSHELRTPLHGILSFAKIGATKGLAAGPEKLVGYFERIGQSGDRLLSLLNDLLDLSKLEAGKMVLEMRRENLLEIIQDVAAEFETLLEAKPVGFVMAQLQVDPGATLDATRIKQVVRNLLSNAIKFTPPGGTIRVSIGPAQLRAGQRASDTDMVPALALQLSDEGIGIPEDELQTIFDKFVQSSRTRTGAGGTGLGLAICKEIVEAHRGTITIRNNANGGATVEVILPSGQ